MFTAQQLIEAGNKTVEWASGHLNEDGSFGGVEERILAYYKAPMAFALAGRAGEAAAVANHLKSTFYRNGDFHAVKDDPTSGGSKNYRNAWIGRGLHTLGFYDLSVPTGDFLESEMDGKTGGVLTASSVEGRDRETDWGNTCSTAIAMLAMGRREAAVRCGDFLAQMLDDQDGGGEALYLRRDGSGEIITDMTGRPANLYAVMIGETGQVYWYLGMAMVAFAGLYRWTGDEKWKKAGDRIYDIVSRCDDEVYAIITNGKVAWGAGAMFAATGDGKFGRLSDKIWTWVCDTQTPEGVWLRPGAETVADQALDVSLDTSLERASYMFDLAKTLAGGDY